jgi:hypothetical protein
MGVKIGGDSVRRGKYRTGAKDLEAARDATKVAGLVKGEKMFFTGLRTLAPSSRR